MQKLLESQPAVKKDRAGELALGNSFLGLPGRGVVSRGAGPAQKPDGGAGAGVKWLGGAAQGGGSGPRSLQKRNFTSMRVILFTYFLRVFCFFLCLLFWYFFCIFLHFLHRLPTPYKKTTRK